MVKKTLKDMGLEVTELSRVMNNMNEKMDVLGREQEIRRTKLSEFEDENIVNKCETCDQVYKSKLELKKHLQTHKTSSASHSVCDHCDKTFKYEEIKQKHISISHKNIKIYCHYFNNSSQCPFAEECVFLHMVSPVCRYGDMCVRDKCMFRHVNKENDDQISDKNNDAMETNDDEDNLQIADDIRLLDKEKDLEIIDINDDAVESNDDEDNVEISNEAEKDDQDNTTEVAIVHVDTAQENQDVDVLLIDSTFVVNDDDNISSSDNEKGIFSEHEKNEKNDEKVINPLQSVDNSSGGTKFVCKQCNFEATTKEQMKEHKLRSHNWCSICFSTFNSIDKLTKHVTTHTEIC